MIEKVATLWPVGLTNAVAATLAAPTVVRVLRNRGPAQTKFPFVTAVMPRSALLAVTRLGGDAAGIFLASELPGKWNSRNRREKKPWS